MPDMRLYMSAKLGTDTPLEVLKWVSRGLMFTALHLLRLIKAAITAAVIQTTTTAHRRRYPISIKSIPFPTFP